MGKVCEVVMIRGGLFSSTWVKPHPSRAESSLRTPGWKT